MKLVQKNKKIIFHDSMQFLIVTEIDGMKIVGTLTIIS